MRRRLLACGDCLLCTITTLTRDQETKDDLRRAYREYAKYNDARLIFDTPQLDLSPLGQDTLFSTIKIPPAPSLEDGEQYWDDLLADKNLIACSDASFQETNYWSALNNRILAFSATEKGRVVANELWANLEECLLSTLYHEGPIPCDLYERVVAVELAWRAEMRCRHSQVAPHLYQGAPPVEIGILAPSDEDRSKFEATTLTLPASHTFEHFGELLCHYSSIAGAQNTDMWSYEVPNALDNHATGHFRPITASVYPNMMKMLIESRRRKGIQVKMILVHESQIEGVTNGGDIIVPRNVLEREIDEDMQEEIEREWDEEVDRASVHRVSWEEGGVLPVPSEEDKLDEYDGAKIGVIKREMGYMPTEEVPQRSRNVSWESTSSCLF